MSKTPLRRIRAACCRRSGGACEACGAHVGEDGELGHLDHFFGRAKVPEAVSNCWILCAVDCDPAKTASRPSARWWLSRFVLHCQRYGYEEEAYRAQCRMDVLEQKFPAP